MNEATQGADMKDPVCGMDVVPGQAAGGTVEHTRTTYWFCSVQCREKFLRNPTSGKVAG